MPWTQERKPRLLAIALLLTLQDPGLVRSEVTQSCVTLCNSIGYSLPGSSVYGIIQAKVLEWVAISFSRGSSGPGDRTWVPHGRQMLYLPSHQGSPPVTSLLRNSLKWHLCPFSWDHGEGQIKEDGNDQGLHRQCKVVSINMHVWMLGVPMTTGEAGQGDALLFRLVQWTS